MGLNLWELTFKTMHYGVQDADAWWRTVNEITERFYNFPFRSARCAEIARCMNIN